MPEPKKPAARSANRPRAKKKAVPALAPVDPEPTLAAAPETPGLPEAPGSVESFLLMGLGTLLVIGALFPRSLRQLLMLGLGGSLLYRGMTAPRPDR